jgi:hypothetical protein
MWRLGAGGGRRERAVGAVTRILIADGHEVVRSGLRKILETQPGWEVVGEAADEDWISIRPHGYDRKYVRSQIA